MNKKNIFIIGFNEFNENELNTIKGAENYNFIPLLTEEQIKSSENNEIKLLEINPRMSQSHSDLYAKVTGHSNHQVLMDLAQGKVPDFKHEKGPFNYAAEIHHRHFHDGIVKHFPNEKSWKK